MLTEEEKKKQLQKIEKAQQKAEKQKEEDSALAEAQAKIKKLQEELDKEKENNEDLREAQARKYESENALEAEQAVNAIINDDNTQVFSKSYEYASEDKTPSLKFNVILHAPTLSELGAIEQVFIDLTNGRGQDYGSQMYFLFRAVATFKVMGDEIHDGSVPEFLKDPKQIHRWDIISDVYSDFLDWQDTFQKTQRH